MGSEHIDSTKLDKIIIISLIDTSNCEAVFNVVSHFSPLASICIEGEAWLLGDFGRSIAWCWVVVWVWQLTVEAGPPCFASLRTALIWECHGGVLFHTELGQSLFPL